MLPKTLQLDIKLDGKLDPSVQAAFTKLSNLASKTSRNLQMNNVGDSINKLAGISQKLMKTTLVGVSAVAAGVGVVLTKAVNAASDLQEVQNVVDVTFGKNSEQVNAWSKSVLNSYGLSELSAKKYSSTMGAMLKSSGVSSEKLLEMSQSMTQLTGDMASFYNLDNETAFEKIRSGISGETEPLKQLGINMGVANLEAYAMSMGIKKSYQNMTQAEQTTLRYSYLLKATSDAQGDFARTQGNYANQLRTAKENLTKLSISIGTKLLPVITPMIQKFNDWIQNIPPEKIQEMADKFANMATNGLSGITDFVTNTIPKIIDGIGFVIKHGPLIAGIIGGLVAATTALSFAQLYLNIVTAANPMTWIILGIVAAITLLTGAIIYCWLKFAGFRAFMAGMFEFIKSGFINAFAIIKPIVDGIILVFKGLIEFISGVFTGNWKQAFSGLGNIVKGVFSGMVGVLAMPLNSIIAGVNTLIDGANLVGGTVGVKIPKIPNIQIPYLAQGATVMSPTLAMIGEAGMETVVPHNNKPRSKALAMTAAKGAGVSMGNTIQITFAPIIYGNDGSIKEELQQAYSDFESQMDRYFANKERVSYGV